MNSFAWRPAAVFGGVLLVAALIALGLIWATDANPSGSNGELIYFTGSNDRGERITYRRGTDFIGPGMMMDTRLSCASCHGTEARGVVSI